MSLKSPSSIPRWQPAQVDEAPRIIVPQRRTSYPFFINAMRWFLIGNDEGVRMSQRFNSPSGPHFEALIYAFEKCGAEPQLTMEEMDDLSRLVVHRMVAKHSHKRLVPSHVVVVLKDGTLKVLAWMDFDTEDAMQLAISKAREGTLLL